MRKSISTSLMILMISGVLTGCFPDGKKTLSDDAFTNDLTAIAEEQQETLAENLIIDADVTAPNHLPTKNYQVTLKELDKENVEQIFLSGKEIREVKEIPNTIDETKMSYVYNTDDEASLVIDMGRVSFVEQQAIDRHYTRYIKGDSFFIDYHLDEIFPKERLNNVDREASVQSFKDICQKLDIEISGEPDVYALDAESLDAVTDYEEAQPNGEPIKKWTEEDQAYFITAHVLYDEFPMTQFGYITESGYGIGTRIHAIFGVGGLIEFSADGIYETTKEGDEITQICSLDTANTAIKEKYKNTILSNPVRISEIRLEYLPVQKDMEQQLYELTPMWIYTASQKSQIEKEGKITEITNTFQIYIDALTGKEFDVGGMT